MLKILLLDRYKEVFLKWEKIKFYQMIKKNNNNNLNYSLNNSNNNKINSKIIMIIKIKKRIIKGLVVDSL